MLNIISLGAGVQSSTMALMAAKGEITPMPDCAIFADTQAEPDSVYSWLDWLEKQLPFPVYKVTKGNLWDDELKIKKSSKSGRLYLKNSIPAFVLKEDGTKGLLGRKCTSDYKITPIQRKIKELAGVKRATKGVVLANVLIGISTDEAHRMKPSRADYLKNSWPLIELNMTRQDCLSWMAKNNFPQPPRSACVFCPFHSDSEWFRLKNDEPKEFDRVIEFERKLQAAATQQETLKGIPFLHGSGKAIDSVDFENLVQKSHSQLDLFGNECEGMCGV